MMNQHLCACTLCAPAMDHIIYSESKAHRVYKNEVESVHLTLVANTAKEVKDKKIREQDQMRA
jgi:hypothetical protein